jgi:2-oxoglutarate ferredoxin oxidoreductase subunit beta
VRQVRRDILYAFDKPGFSFIEVLSPCPIGFGKSNQMSEGLDEMLLYRDRCVVSQDVALAEVGIDLEEDRPIYVGRFLDRDQDAYKPATGGQPV